MQTQRAGAIDLGLGIIKFFEFREQEKNPIFFLFIRAFQNHASWKRLGRYTYSDRHRALKIRPTLPWKLRVNENPVRKSFMLASPEFYVGPEFLMAQNFFLAHSGLFWAYSGLFWAYSGLFWAYSGPFWAILGYSGHFSSGRKLRHSTVSSVSA